MIYDKKEEVKIVIPPIKEMKKIASIGISSLVGLVVLSNSVYTIDGGEIAIRQTPSGDLVPIMEPGIKFKVPFASKVYKYNEVTTVTYSKTEEGNSRATSDNLPYPISFADTYSGLIKGSFRIDMPKDPGKFIELHKAFKRYDNFVQNGINKFTNELLTYTANQFTGEMFMQGGQNEYKFKVLDQAQKGLYITKREATEVKRQSGDVGLSNYNSGKTSDVKQIIYKNVIQLDENGKPKRSENSMTKYGIVVTQVTLDGFIPEKALQTFIANKKLRVQERAKLIEDQENERQKAINAKLKGDRERIEAKQQMLKDKDAAVIEADKKVALEKKAAELLIVRKKKELEIAKANKGIQEAKYEAKKFEAKSILEVGLAEAKVTEAKYKAIDKSIFKDEVRKAIVLNFSDNLKNFNIKMPQYLVSSSSDGGKNNSLNVVMDVLGIKSLQDISKNISIK